MIVVPFRRSHMDTLLVAMGLPLSSLNNGQLELMETPGHAYTALNQGRPIGACGVLPIWTGVGEAVGFITPEVRESARFTFLAVKEGLELIQREYKYHRIQMSVEMDFKAGYRFAHHLGFKFEGAMPLYTADKRTFMRYGKVWL